MRTEIPARRRPLRMALLVVWLAAFAWVASSAAAALTAPDLYVPTALMVAWLLMWAAGAVAAAGSLAWLLWGREVIQMTPDSLAIRRQIGPFGRTRTFDVPKVSNIRPCAGGVEFDYRGHRERFASGLDRDAAEELAAKMTASLRG
jgi:hypothetical protein